MLITPNMTMLDVAMNATGTVESIFSILEANDKGLTDIPHVGDNYIIPDDAITDDVQLKYLQSNRLIIATGNDPGLYIGISYWKVELDFKVS